MTTVVFGKSIAFMDDAGRVVAPEPGKEVQVNLNKRVLESWEKAGVLSFVRKSSPKNKAKGAAPEKK
ncbi:hypothetical protein HMPREF9374_1118 [Desmospora sp. 8437]|nr:hypothetical protein HMPREF9374_1118 [Desmospora sp. 8437]